MAQQELLSTVAVARLIGVAEHRLVYAYRTGKLAEPTHWVGGQRVYTARDVRRVRQYFQNKRPWTLGRRKNDQ